MLKSNFASFILIIVLSLCFNHVKSGNCPFIACGTASLGNGICARLSPSEDHSEDTISLTKCIKGKSCSYSFQTYIELKELTEEKCITCSETEIVKFGGEVCSSDSDCSSIILVNGESQTTAKCVNNKCETNSLNSNCNDDGASCPIGTTCRKTSRKCEKLLEEGEQCQLSYECGFNLLCHQFRCTKLFSIQNGATVSTDDEMNKGLLCKSGYAYESKCAKMTYKSSSKTNKDGVVDCEIDSECEYNIYFSNNNEVDTIKQACICGQSGKSYCPLPNNNEDSGYYQNYLTSLKAYYSDILPKTDKFNIKNKLTVYDESVNKLKALFTDYTTSDCILEVMQIVSDNSLSTYEIKSLSTNINHTFDVKKREAYVIKYTNLSELINNNKITFLLDNFYENIVIGVSYKSISTENLPSLSDFEYTFESGKSKLFQFDTLLHKLFTTDNENKGLYFYIYLKEESDKDLVAITLSFSNTKDHLYMMGYHLYYNENAFDNLFSMNLTLKKNQKAIFLLDYKNITYEKESSFFIGDLYNNNYNIKLSYSTKNTVSIYSKDSSEDSIKAYFYPTDDDFDYETIEVNSEFDLLSIIEKNTNHPILIKVENNNEVNYEFPTHATFFIQLLKSIKNIPVDPVKNRRNPYYILKLTTDNRDTSLSIDNSPAEYNVYIRNLSTDYKLRFSINSYSEDIDTEGKYFYDFEVKESSTLKNTIELSSTEKLASYDYVYIIVSISAKTTRYRLITNQRTEVAYDPNYLYYAILNSPEDLNLQENMIEIASTSSGFTNANYEIALYNKNEFMNKLPSELENNIKSYHSGNSSSLLYDFSFLNNFDKSYFVYVIFSFKSNTTEKINTYAYNKKVQVIDTDESDNYYVKLDNSAVNFYYNTLFVITPSSSYGSDNYLLTNIIYHESMVSNVYYAIGSISDYVRSHSNQEHFISEEIDNLTGRIKTVSNENRDLIFVRVFAFANKNIIDTDANIYISNTFVDNKDAITDTDFESYKKNISISKSNVNSEFSAQIKIDDFAKDKQGNTLRNKYYLYYKYKSDSSDAKYDTSSFYNYLDKGYGISPVTFKDNSSPFKLSPLDNGIYDFIIVGENIKTQIIGFYKPIINEYFAYSLIINDYNTIEIEKPAPANIYYFQFTQTSYSLFYLYFGNLNQKLVASKKLELVKINKNGDNITTTLFSENNDYDTRQKFEIEALKEEEPASYIIKVNLTFISKSSIKERNIKEETLSFDMILNNFSLDSKDQMLTIHGYDHKTMALKSSTIFKQIKLLSSMRIMKIYIESEEKDLVNMVEFNSNEQHNTISQETIYSLDPETKETNLTFLSEDFKAEEDKQSNSYSSYFMINLSEDKIKEVSDIDNIKNLSVYLFDSIKPLKKVCSLYTCDALGDTECFERKNQKDDTEAWIFDIYKCQDPDRNYCNVNPENIENYESSNEWCSKEPTFDSYIGSFCLSNENCMFDSSKCINNVCTQDTIVSNCERNGQCNAGYYCDTDLNKCKMQKEKDMECQTRFECKNNAECYNNKCVEIYSLENGSETIDLQTIVNKYCKSGFAVNNKCTELYLKSEIGKECDLDSDCVYTDSSGEEIKVENSCECAFNNDNRQYCLIGNTPEYNSYISKIKEKQTDPHCHTEERDDKCFSNYYNYELRNELYDLEKESIYKHKLINASSCVNDYFFSKIIMPIPDPSDNDCDISCSNEYDFVDKCIEKSQKDSGTSGKFEFYNYCDKNKHCEYNAEKLLTQDKYESHCEINRYEIRYPGEHCNLDSDCTITNSICINSACSETNSENCNDSSSCKSGEFCDRIRTKKCVPQRKLGEQCIEAFDCLNNLVCYNKSCVEPFTLDIGTNIEKQDEFSKKYLCSTNLIVNGVCAATKYANFYQVDSEGLVACNSQSKCKYLVQTKVNGEWESYAQKCNCSFSYDNDAYCPYSTSDDLTLKRNQKIMKLKKNILNNNRHTLLREKGNINELRKNYSQNCIEANSHSYYHKINSCIVTTLGFSNCYSIVKEIPDNENSIELPENEIFNFKNNQDPKINFKMKQESKFYLYSLNYKASINKIEIKSELNQVLKVIEGKELPEKEIFESEVLNFPDIEDKLILSIVFEEHFNEEVDFYFYLEYHHKNPKYAYLEYNDGDIGDNDNTIPIGNFASFDYTKPFNFILNPINYNGFEFTKNNIHNKVQTFYEINNERNINDFQTALIFDDKILSARSVFIDKYEDTDINIDEFSTIYKTDENNILHFKKRRYDPVYLFIEVTFKPSKEIMKYGSNLQIIRPIFQNTNFVRDIKELSFKISTNKKKKFQGIELHLGYDFIYNDLKIYSNNRNVKVSIGYGKINVNSILRKEADYDLNTNPIQTVALDKSLIKDNNVYFSVYYDGDSDDEIYFSIGISDDKIISISDSELSYYYNINNDEKVYLLYFNSIETRNSFIFKSLINKPTILKAEIDQFTPYKTIYNLKTDVNFSIPIESQIYNDDSKKIGFTIFELSVSQVNEIVSGKFIVKREDSKVLTKTKIGIIVDDYELNKDDLIVTSDTQSKTISFNQEDKHYKFDITLLKGLSTLVYINEETKEYAVLNEKTSVISIINSNMNKITFKNNSKDDSDSYILVSSATELDYTDKIVTKNQEKVVSSKLNDNYSTLIFEITKNTQFNYIYLKSIKGELDAIEKSIIPLNNNNIYFSETKSINSPRELGDISEYSQNIENPTNEGYYVILRIRSKSTSNTGYSYRAKYSSDVLISLESGKVTDSLSFPKLQKTIKKFEISTTINSKTSEDENNYLSLSIASNNLSPDIACIVSINYKDFYSSFDIDKLLTKIGYENKIEGKSSIIIACNNLSNEDLNIFVIGADVSKDYTKTLDFTDYTVGMYNDRDLQFDLKQIFYIPKEKIEYYVILQEYASDRPISYYYYITNKEKYHLLINYQINHSLLKLKHNVKYSTNIVAFETTYNTPVLYDTIAYLNTSGDDSSSSETSKSSSDITDSSSSEKKKSSISWWWIVLIVISAIFVIVIVLISIKCILNRRKNINIDNTKSLLDDSSKKKNKNSKKCNKDTIANEI